MGSPLEDIEFLARSEHRVTALDALSKRPQSRADLRALTGTSSSTIGRMLGEFEHRNWISRDGHQYQATLLGAFVAKEVMTLHERMGTERKLRDVVRWFPADEVDFDIVRCLGDAEVVVPTESDPTAPIRRASGQLQTGTRLRFLTTQVTVSYFNSIKKNVVRDEMTVEAVVTPDAHDTLVNDTAMAALWQDLYDSDDVVFSVAGDLPLILQIVDDTIGIGLVDGAKVPRALLLSDDETVHKWAVDTFETYRDEAEPICGP